MDTGGRCRIRTVMSLVALCLGLSLGGCGGGQGDEQAPREASEPEASAQASDPVQASVDTPQGAPGPEPLAQLPDLGRLDPLGEARELRDPEADDWRAEARGAAVSAFFEELYEGAPLQGRVAEDFAAPELGLDPARAEPGGTAAFAVRRADGGAAPGPAPGPAPGSERASGAAGLASAWSDLVGPDPARSKFKVVAVAGAGDESEFEAQVRLELAWKGAAEQLVARWRTRWREAGDGAPPTLVGLEVLSAERTASRSGTPLFTDITAEVLGGNRAFERQLGVDLERWSANLDGALGASIIGHEGFALGDADGDGLDDLYVCQTGGLPNLLFLRRPDGTAEEVGRASGVDWLDASRSALFADLDRDGDQDLVVEADPRLLLMRNDGQGRFELAGTAEAPATTSLSAADADGDGDLDLYACAYMLPDTSERVPLPYHDANNGRRNTFLLNETAAEGPWRFVDATAAAGLDVNNRRFSFAAAWEDYDGDGDPDLYVANDFGRNNLYRNEGPSPADGAPRFVDVAAEAGVEDMAAGMGVTWGDVDGDGLSDLHVSNMFSSAGGRITYQRRFRAGSEASELEDYRRHARGNSLFLNRGDGTFADVSEASGVTMGRWSWGALFTDFENDGRLDLVVPNGFVTGADPLDL